jgi:C4-dicarboxylate-specific signal transduction histidine kinase
MIAMTTGQPQRGTIGLRLSNKNRITWISINAIPLFKEEKTKPYAALVSFTDVSEQKESAKQLIEQQAVVANSARISSLGVMASGIAHEINNPLAVISGRASQIVRMLENNELKSEALWPIVKNIEHTVQRISKIIHGLKSFARDGHADPFVITPVAQVIEDAVVVCKEMFSRRNIELKMHVSPGLLIDCRSVQITQVLVNLLQNAVDAVEDNSERWVKLSAYEGESGYICLSIEDSGSGIPKIIRDRIMEPFFTTKAVGKGTGLGLSISAGIIHSHNGSLYIDEKCPNT